MTRISVHDWGYAAELTMKQGGGTFNGEGFVSKPDNGYIVGGVVPTETIEITEATTIGRVAEKTGALPCKAWRTLQ
jgi:hypothetical protein